MVFQQKLTLKVILFEVFNLTLVYRTSLGREMSLNYIRNRVELHVRRPVTVI